MTARTPVRLNWLVVVKGWSPGIIASGRSPRKFDTRMNVNKVKI
jgi:hypothetical protein